MSKVVEFGHDLWVAVQLKAPPSVQRTVISRLHDAKEIARLVIRPYLPVYQLQGQGQGGPLTVTYVGLGFSRPFWKSFIFVEDPVEQQVGQIPVWRYDKVASLSWGDILFVEATKHLIRKLPQQGAIVLPERVDHILDVQGDWQDVRNRFHKSVRKNELRLMRKYGYEYHVSCASQDFEEFYHQMYLPTTGDRHGELSFPKSVGEAYLFFRRGWLFRVERGGDWVSGVVCHPQGDVLLATTSGVKNGDAQLVHDGATAATYYAAIHWANQHGYKAVNFLGSGARLSGGLFQHKRKWGSTVSVSPNLHRQIWIRVRQITPAVSQFLKENPLITVDRDGELHGLIMVDDPSSVSAETRKEWEKSYATPGLSSLIVRSVSSLAQEPADARDADLVIPIPSGSGFGNEPCES